jgi:hypothetical protein
LATNFCKPATIQNMLSWTFRPCEYSYFPSYQRLVQRSGNTISRIWTGIICGVIRPAIALVLCMLITPHFGFCFGTSNVHFRSLTVNTTDPDSTTQFVGNGILMISESTLSNCLTNILPLFSSELRKLNRFSWNPKRHSRFVSLPASQTETSPMPPSRARTPLDADKNRIDDCHPAGLSERSREASGDFGFSLVIKRATAEAVANGWLRGSFFHSLVAAIPATIISPKTPTITSHSPHLRACFQNRKELIVLYGSFSASNSMTSPSNSTTPDAHAQKTGQKYDWVVVTIYICLCLVGIGVAIALFKSIRETYCDSGWGSRI